MTAKELINNKLNPLHPEMLVGEALDEINLSGVAHLPVVSELKVLGFVSSETLSTVSPEDLIQNHIENNHASRVYENIHLFELMKLFGQSELSALATVDHQDQFTGIVLLSDLMFQLQNNYNHLQNPIGEGGIITLELEFNNYSLSEIARIAEMNDTKILALYVSQPENNKGLIEVAMQFDRPDIRNILATFERFKYSVKSSNLSEEDIEQLRHRYNALMKYLSM